MKIEKIYIGGWFQRNMLHLTEIYDFLKNGTSRLPFDEHILQTNKESLDIKELVYGTDGFDNIEYTTNSHIKLKIFEDGLIVLSHDNISKDFKTEIDLVTNYYENIFSPALNYLFHLGAPVPKELANIKTVYPYFFVMKNATKKQMENMLEKTDKQKYFEYDNKSFHVLRGDKYFLIKAKEITMDKVEKYIEEQIFIREFKGQLHRYLNLHRMIWQEISAIKDKPNIKQREINAVTTKLDNYAKTINLVETRINQMNSYLKTREKIAKSDKDFQSFMDIMEYKYETLGNTLSYIQQIWTMTKNHVNSAKSLYSSLQNKITQKAVNNLSIISSITAASTMIGFLSKEKFPQLYVIGVLYFVMVFIIGLCINKGIRFFSGKGKYKINDKDYEKFDDK